MVKKKSKKKKRKRKLNRKRRPPVPKISQAEIDEFVVAGDYLFWLAHGCNYLNSSYDEGLWNPIFTQLYGGICYTQNQIISYLMDLYFSESEGEWSPIGKVLAAWALQDSKKVFLFYRRVLREIKKVDPSTVRQPYLDGLWKLFNEIKFSFEENFVAFS